MDGGFLPWDGELLEPRIEHLHAHERLVGILGREVSEGDAESGGDLLRGDAHAQPTPKLRAVLELGAEVGRLCAPGGGESLGLLRARLRGWHWAAARGQRWQLERPSQQRRALVVRVESGQPHLPLGAAGANSLLEEVGDVDARSQANDRHL